MVTKQQQLEWLAKRFESLPYHSDIILMSDDVLGYLGYGHRITNQELKRERDKMQKQPAQPAQPAQSTQPTPDNSWHERGERPPVGALVEKKYKSATIWTEVKIIAAGNQLVIFAFHDGDEMVGDWSDYEFRPLRTEREKAIDEISASIGANFRFEGYDLHARITRSLSEVIYDAGYRKVKL